MCVRECLRVVKLAETARAAHRSSWLHHSSLGEEWLCTMPAVLPSGLDSLYALRAAPSVSLSLLPLSLSFLPLDSLYFTQIQGSAIMIFFQFTRSEIKDAPVQHFQS